MIAKWPKVSYPEDNGVFEKISDFLEYQRKTVTPYATSWCEARDEQLRHQLTFNSEGKVVYKGTESIWKAVREMRDSYTPDFDFVKITAPTLCIFPIRDNTYYIFSFMNQSEREQMVEFYDTVQLPWYRQCIENFRRDVPHAKIVELQHSHTYFIITQEDLVYNEMRMFLENC